MRIQQFYDTQLAHASYAIEHQGKVALVDPARNPKPYQDFADQHQAQIVVVLETHPHADFVSSHLEWQKQGATVFIHPDVGVSYEHTPVVDGDTIPLNGVYFKTLFTPGHSPDHNSYLLHDEHDKPIAVFTGDSLFIGDVGRPDLREGAGNLKSLREDLARQMYHTVHDVFMNLPDDVTVYPAHGAGSLCGKNLSDETSSTMGQQKQFNWAFQTTDEDEFVKTLTDGQPFVPKYFPYDVELNRVGAPDYQESLSGVKQLPKNSELESEILVVDIREAEDYKNGHLPGSINIPNTEGDRLETWVGSLVAPETLFYILGSDPMHIANSVSRLAKIGYEPFIKATVQYDSELLSERTMALDVGHFRIHPEAYTIVDLRNTSELVTNGKKFDTAINVPLPDLWEKGDKIPTGKPVVLHCAGGYRSAVGESILDKIRPDLSIYDLGNAIETFEPVNA